MKTVIIFFAIIEFIAIIYTLFGIYEYIVQKLQNKYDEILKRCADDVKFRNKLASYIFFFQDMGPSISSFSIISLFTTERNNITALLVIFFVGIIMKEKSRKLKNLFYEEIDKRSTRCQSEQ